MRVEDLDIPPGLEEFYFKVVQFANGSSQNVILLRRTKPARSRFYTVGNRSLFVRFKPLWATFDSARRTRWQVYWASLPFGSHGGVDGYPGSGYSAFIYINAPRYESDLYILLDPPNYPALGSERLQNLTPFPGYSPWTFGGSVQYLVTPGGFVLSSGTNGFFSQYTIGVIAGRDYHLELDVKVTGFNVADTYFLDIYLGYNDNQQVHFDLHTISDNTLHRLSFDITIPEVPGYPAPDGLQFLFPFNAFGVGQNQKFSNFSLKEYV